MASALLVSELILDASPAKNYEIVVTQWYGTPDEWHPDREVVCLLLLMHHVTNVIGNFLHCEESAAASQTLTPSNRYWRSQKRQGFEAGSLEETKMGYITQAARLRVLHIILFRLDGLDSDFKLEEKSGLQREC
ncbi:hypothetical protein EDD22DRAFT_841751 [Suillus occidentalis]|nr:hypothetical protein EDD22DRAFT_841751 [Suillus occidentalis]